MKTPTPKKQRRGFAVMTPEQRKRIATLGGRSVSMNRKHMSRIGTLGGKAIHK